MKLTKLVAAPELHQTVPPRARAVGMGAGITSQLIWSDRCQVLGARSLTCSLLGDLRRR